MMKMRHYRSAIPAGARERIVSTHEPDGAKRQVEYTLGDEVVGRRWFDQDGSMGSETPLKSGQVHGTLYYFSSSQPDGPLKVIFAEPYRNGLAHGTAEQWSVYDGRFLGSCTMKRGTGIDLWRAETYSGASAYLSEARYIKEGNWHGFEWWLNQDQKTVHKESHFSENLQHGITREWNGQGKLKRGYPKYWVQNMRVTKRQYLRAQVNESNLPPYREVDNLPRRKFPSEVLAAISETASIKYPMIATQRER
jgi:YD repeat-containing protein